MSHELDHNSNYDSGKRTYARFLDARARSAPASRGVEGTSLGILRAEVEARGWYEWITARHEATASAYSTALLVAICGAVAPLLVFAQPESVQDGKDYARAVKAPFSRCPGVISGLYADACPEALGLERAKLPKRMARGVALAEVTP